MLQESLLAFALMGAQWVLWLLVGLSVLCLAVALERVVYILLNATPALTLRGLLAEFSRSRDSRRLAEGLGAVRGAEARILLAGAQAAELGVASVEEALISASTRERMRLDRGLIILGTVGANAPFIGLFGTVLGIIKAFHELSEKQAEAASAVMAGISEALVATAIGLMVAIPAVVLFNVFQRYNKNLMSRMDALAHALLSHLKAVAEPDRTPATGK